MNSFEKSIDLTHRYLDALSFRQNVIADNIANVNTPNFKRNKVSFEAELEKAILNDGKVDLALLKPSDKHLNGIKRPNYLDIKPKRMFDHLSTLNNNGNNVDIDSEVKNLVQNQMMYDLMTNIQTYYFKSINIVIR